MSEFCENCPLRGEIVSAVVGVCSVDAEEQWFFSQSAQAMGRFAILFDMHRKLTEPIRAPSSQNTLHRIEARLDDCAAPKIERTRILRRRRLSCPALGELAIENEYLREVLLARAKAETV